MSLRVSEAHAIAMGWIAGPPKGKGKKGHQDQKGNPQVTVCPIDGIDPQSVLWRKLLARMPNGARTGALVWEKGGIVPGRRFSVDIAWTTNRLAIEVDGYMNHGFSKRGFHRDREKDRLLRLAGWTPARYSAKEINSDPEAVVEEIMALNAAIQHGR